MAGYSSMGFRRFMDRILEEGLTWLGYYFGSYRAKVISHTGFTDLLPPTSGIVGAVSGTAVGAGADLDKIGLLKVLVPAIGDTVDTPPRTAFPRVPLAGSGYGFKNLPPIGSYVWVSFEHGNPDMPIWDGQWWGSGEMPTDLESPDAFGWITPGGHKLLLIDDLGQEKIRLHHKLGGYLEWDFMGNVVLTNFDTGVPGATTITLGEGATEASVLGDTLKGLLDELFDAIAKMTMLSPAGTTSTPVNAAEFAAIKARLQTALSTTNKVK